MKATEPMEKRSWLSLKKKTDEKLQGQGKECF